MRTLSAVALRRSERKSLSRVDVRPGQFQTGPLGLGPAIEESLGSPAKQEQGSQSDRVHTENKQQYGPGNMQNRVLSRAGLM